MPSESWADSPILSALDLIQKACFSCNGASWDLTPLIVYKKSTGKEQASVFMFQSLAIRSPDARIVCPAAWEYYGALL